MGSHITSVWSRIESWLNEHAPEAARSIGPPVDENEIATAEAVLGFGLPDELKDFYRLVGLKRDATELPSICPGVDPDMDYSFYILTVEEMLNEWKGMKELLEAGDFDPPDCEPEHTDAGVAEVWWSTKWVPFAADGGGDCFVIDLGPVEGGAVGQLVTHSHETGEHYILAKSLTDYLSGIADGMESGKYSYDNEEGVLVGAAFE